MDCVITIRYWDDGSEPSKELRLYDMRGQAIGFGEMKISDAQTKNEELDLFTNPDKDERVVTFKAKLDLAKLSKYLEQETNK